LENIAEFTELNEQSQQKLSAHLAKICESEKSKQSLAAMLQNGMSTVQQQPMASNGLNNNNNNRPSSFILLNDQMDL
jgi:hypothetical protein